MVHRVAGTDYRILGCFPKAIAAAGGSSAKPVLVVTEDRRPSRRPLPVDAGLETHIGRSMEGGSRHAPKAPCMLPGRPPPRLLTNRQRIEERVLIGCAPLWLSWQALTLHDHPGLQAVVLTVM